MIRFTVRAALIVSFAFAAAPVFAQTPGVDENDCKPSPLLTRMTGCGVYECEKKEFDASDLVISKSGEPKSLEGEIDRTKLICAATTSHLQIVRNAEAALRKAGYTIVYSGKHDNSDFPVVTGQKGTQWISVQADQWNEFPTYQQTGVLVKAMAQEMTASAQAMSDAIAKSGKLDVYGITFATGQATITPQSDQVLNDVLAVLSANADWQLRIEGHTDNVGDKAANLKLSNARAAAVAAWLSGKGIEGGRLSVAGLGDTQPVAPNTTEDGRAKNRRVVLVKQ